MDTRTYQVGFYQGVHGDQDTEETVGGYLVDWAEGEPPEISMGGYTYRLKELQNHKGRMLQGVLAKFRHDDLPKIGSPKSDQEKNIPLGKEEGLIEKNHFIYDKKRQLLVYQQNGHGSTHNQLGQYITQATNVTTVFNPVVQPDAMERLIKGGFKPKKLQLSVAKPSPALMKGHAFNRGLMNMMAEGNAQHINITMSMGHSVTEYLFMDVGAAMDELMGHADVKIARLNTVDDDGIEHPIDLIADRIRDRISVKMVDRYPDSAEVFQELTKAKNRNEPLIKAILGE